MDHVLAGHAALLTYLCDRRALADIDWPDVLDDLIDAGAPPNRCLWTDLERLDHVVIARDRVTHRHVGLLGLAERKTVTEPFLLIDAAMVRAGDGHMALLTAMLAHMLARVASLNAMPVAIASHSADALIGPALRQVGAAIASATMHPGMADNVIDFGAASLSHRMGRVGAVLDLRQVEEAGLLRDLRRLHRIRPAPVKPRPVAAKPARGASATRRPKTATRTGKTG